MSAVHHDTLMALTAGIQSEVASYVFYREAALKDIDNEVKDILTMLALEEKDHYMILERQYDALVRSEKWNTTTDALRKEGLPEVDEEMQEKHRELIDEVTATGNDIHKILLIALRLEEEACDLFDDAVQKVDSAEGKEMFRRLAKFEEGHARKINELIKKY
ncbi:MAG TPA: ferritin family protein [candidate division Zixibacteria bacterium]|nr:ferritin family protein [candidate division Zixibacteria bacterium]